MTVTKTKHHLKNWLIAHSGNDHLPHILRAKGVGIGIALILISQVTFNYMAAGRLQLIGYAANINTADLLQLTNNERANHGVAPLSANGRLNQAALNKANHMLQNDYWAHTAPDGTTPWYFITQAGYTYDYAAENLAKDFSTSQGVIAGWMGSGGHRQNLLNSTYTEIGLAVVSGTLQGSQTTLVVAMYAKPKAPPPPPPQTAQPQPTPPPAPPEVQPPEPEPEPETEPEPEPEPEPENQDLPPGLDLTPTNHQVVPVETDYGLTRPLSLNQTLTSAEKATAFILSGFLFANTMNHTIIWRKRHTRLKRARHIWFKTHPLLQAVILAIPLLIMLLSGLGTVL